jgi:hypothetical protein
VTATELSAVVLVGGSSRIPLVQELLTTRLGRPVVLDSQPQLAIALGAAVSTSLPPEVPASFPGGSPTAELGALLPVASPIAAPLAGPAAELPAESFEELIRAEPSPVVEPSPVAESMWVHETGPSRKEELADPPTETFSVSHADSPTELLAPVASAGQQPERPSVWDSRGLPLLLIGAGLAIALLISGINAVAGYDGGTGKAPPGPQSPAGSTSTKPWPLKTSDGWPRRQ